MKCFIYWTADWKSSKLRSSQLWTQFKQLRIEAWESQDFNGVWTHDLAIPVPCSNQLSYIATDVGSWSVVSSNEPVKNGCEVIYEMFHNYNVTSHAKTFPTTSRSDSQSREVSWEWKWKSFSQLKESFSINSESWEQNRNLFSFLKQLFANNRHPWERLCLFTRESRKIIINNHCPPFEQVLSFQLQPFFVIRTTRVAGND